MNGKKERHALDRLLLRTAQGDRAAFRDLYHATSGKLFATLIRILANEAEAGDVLQEVYLTVWRRASQYDSRQGSAISWLAVVTRNAGIDALRRRRSDTEDDDILKLHPSSEPTPYEVASTNRLRQGLIDGVQGLPAAQRDAVWMFYLEERSLNEISQLMSAPLNTVKSWIRRGVASLRKELNGSSLHELV